MMKLKSKLSILIILAMIFTMALSSQVYAKDVPGPASLEKASNAEIEVLEKQNENDENLTLKLDKLNFYQNPMRIKQISENIYEVELYDLLFEYGSVRLSMESEDHDIPIDRLIEVNDSIVVDLDRKEYDCEIRIVDDEKNTITYIGTIIPSDTGMVYNIEIIDEGNYSNISLAHSTTETAITLGDIELNATTREVEPNNYTYEATVIKDGNDMYGTMNGDRTDYYKIEFVSSGKTNFWIGEYTKGPHYLYVYKGSTLVGSSTNTTGTQQLVTLNVSPGTYYMKVVLPSNVGIPTKENYRARVKFYGNLIWPVSSGNITACFGQCPNYEGLGVNKDGNHYGVDVNCGEGTTVKSMHYGNVVVSTRSTTGSLLDTYGNYIEITSENPRTTGNYNKYLKARYAHLKTRSVLSGNIVDQGQTIGYSGDTGEAGSNYGYHLHFETLYGDSLTGASWVRTDPLNYFTGKACSHRTSLQTEMRSTANTYDKQIPGISINGDFIDADSLINMTSEQLKRFGIAQEDVYKFSLLLKNNAELYEQYNDELLNIEY